MRSTELTGIDDARKDPLNAPANNTEQRARFEAWWMSRTDTSNWDLLPAKTAGYDYASHSVQIAFSAFQAAETPLLKRIAELEGQLANEKIEVAKLSANVSGKTHRIAELKEKLANREPFVVKIPDYHYVLGCPCVWVDEIKAAITAAGGVCE